MIFGIGSWTRGILYGVLIFVVFVAISIVGSGAISWALPTVPQSYAELGKGVMIVLFAPIAEELLFRFMIMQGLVRVMPFIAALLLQAVLFGFAHVAAYSGIGGAGAILGASIFGLMAGLAFWQTGNILVPMVAHGLINLFILLQPLGG